MASQLLRRSGEKEAPCCTSCLTSCCLISYRFGVLSLYCRFLPEREEKQWRVSALYGVDPKIRAQVPRLMPRSLVSTHWQYGKQRHNLSIMHTHCPADSGAPP